MYGCLSSTLRVRLMRLNAVTGRAPRHPAGAGVKIQSSYPETAKIVSVHQLLESVDFTDLRMFSNMLNGRSRREPEMEDLSSRHSILPLKVVHFNDGTCGHI